MSFRFLEHTADVRAECRAPDFPGLLESAARALYEVALVRTRARVDARRSVELRAADRDDLLIRWLQELLFLMDVERFVATNIEFEGVGATELKATVSGYTHEPEERATEVKAATHHGMHIEEHDGDLVATVVFDI